LAELDPPLSLGVASVIRYHDFWKKFNISGTPTLIWFEKGKRFEYTGTRNKDDLVNWVK